MSETLIAAAVTFLGVILASIMSPVTGNEPAGTVAILALYVSLLAYIRTLRTSSRKDRST